MWTDILKGGGKRIKINGEHLKQAIAGYLRDTDYRDVYFKGAISEDILERYLAIRTAEGERGSTKKRLEVQLNSSLMRYVPKGYTRQILTAELKEKLGVKGFSTMERIWLKDAVSLTKGRGAGAALNSTAIRTAIAEYVEETNYKDYYLKPELMEEISIRYKHTKTISYKRWDPLGTAERTVINRPQLRSKLQSSLMNYVPKGYKKVKLTVKLKKYLGIDEIAPKNQMFWLKDTFYLEYFKKSKRGQKIYGSLYRKIIADYIESTGSLERYYAIPFVEEILDTYYEAHRELRSSQIGKKNTVPSKIHIRDKLRAFIGGYLPEEYESKIIHDRGHVRVLQRKNSNPQTEGLKKSKEVEKLRTDSGERLRLKDWDEFKLRLRRMLNTEVPVNIYGRKSSVRIVDGPIVGDKAVIDISFRSLQGDRRYVNVNFIEEEGDYLFTNVEGDIQIPDTEIFNSEFKLRERITQMVVEELTFENEEQDLREKEEEELTEEENIRQLEAANPDSYWDREKGKLVQREVIPEDPPARDLNLEEAAKLGRVNAKREEDKQKNLARLRSLKNKLKNLSAHRGNRGRRDVP